MEPQPQVFNQWVEDNWSSAEPCISQLFNTVSALWPNYLSLDEPLAYNFEDLPSLDELETSSPSCFELPSPISDFSAPGEEYLGDQTAPINPWVTPTSFGNKIISLTTSCSSPMEIPDLASSSGSSRSSSPEETEHKLRTTRLAKAGRKDHTRSKKFQAKPSGRHNAHNLIEKRYRNSLNTKIQTLRDCIPCFSTAVKEEEEGGDEVDSDSGESRRPMKCNKGVILDQAISYIAELEKQKKKVVEENARIRSIIDGCLDPYLYAGGAQTKGVMAGQMLRAV